MSSTQEENGAATVKVMAKAVRVLDALAARGELSAAELASAVGIPRPSVYRLLATLEPAGFVEAGGRTGTYRLGMALYRYGSAVGRRFEDVREVARPHLDRLRGDSGQTIFLTIRKDLDAVCLDRLDGELVGVMILAVGGSVPLHGGANARALLAFEPEALWERYVASGPMHRYTPRTVTEPDALRKELRTVRRQGYSISDEDVIPGISSVGAPLFDHAGRVCASISVSGPTPLVLGDQRRQTIAQVLAASAAISADLGYAP